MNWKVGRVLRQEELFCYCIYKNEGIELLDDSFIFNCLLKDIDPFF